MKSPTERLTDTWDPSQYGRFAAERDQPFHDLLALIEPVTAPSVLDLGCGDGRLTLVAHERLGAARTIGIDSSEAMLARARAESGVQFEHGDIGDVGAALIEQCDVVVANASLQWVPDHRATLARWSTLLRPGGQLAVQVPANADHPSHLVIARVVDELGLDPRPAPDPVAANVLAPEHYAEVLDGIGFERQHVRLQVYAHRLPATAAVVEWVKGTTLTRVRAVTDAATYEQFVARYRERLLAVLGEHRPYLFLFKRILLWGRLPG